MTSSENGATETATRVSATPSTAPIVTLECRHDTAGISGSPRCRDAERMADVPTDEFALLDLLLQGAQGLYWQAERLSAPPEGRERVRRIRAAQLHQEALLIHVVVCWAVHLYSIADLDLETDLVRDEAGQIVGLRIPDRVKSRIATEIPVPPHLGDRLREQLAAYGPALRDNESPWLFPLSAGDSRDPRRMVWQLCDAAREAAHTLLDDIRNKWIRRQRQRKSAASSGGNDV